MRRTSITASTALGVTLAVVLVLGGHARRPLPPPHDGTSMWAPRRATLRPVELASWLSRPPMSATRRSTPLLIRSQLRSSCRQA